MMDDLLQLADDVGVHVTWRDLGRRRGEYRHGPRLITLNPRMSGVLQRSTLAHELGHHHHGDTWTDDPALLDTRERRADAYAAELLISPAEYALAERLVGPHPGAIARELNVARYVVDAWRATRLATVPAQRRSA
ncbi:ImmA/IrrE family metallo-endopeptidase [Cellulomonas sp.]|uniref:ImmA/IrrE family metallo-endopeptidase n=1 Tax=Cellulomonas sp. TaxID=40001 RepID=UPI001B0C05C1|nr:ImmA/IrrE family metallo-endopeptidase [Cellulomonas sp.]MBO9556726.1 ImmA/IrrE family metallo-endopeptidase [Cellulomonas sp.]